MANEILITAVFTLIVLALGFAWVGGYLDAYQKKAQERALDMMGENKASYGLKSMHFFLPGYTEGIVMAPVYSRVLRYLEEPED